MKYLICLFLFSLLLLPVAHAANQRGPAVDPVFGISIDEQPVIPPEHSKGYDFNIQRRKLASTDSSVLGHDNVTPAVMIFLLLSLPFAIRFGVLRNLKPASKTLPENAVDLAGVRQKKEEETKISKAS